MRSGHRILSAAALLALGLLANPAGAAIIAVSGQGNILDPSVTPVGYTANFFQDTGDNRLIHGWDELQNVALEKDILVDIVAPGTYDRPFTSAKATLAQGTMVSSHFLYLDPVGSAERSATFTFDADILGVIVDSDLTSGDHLLASDFLGTPFSVAYPLSHFTARGIEFGPETITLHAGLRMLTVDLVASNPGDQIRVITAAPVPEPSSLALAGIGLVGVVGLAARRRLLAAR